MAEDPVYFDDDARKRIRRSVRATEAGDQIGRGPRRPQDGIFPFQIKLGKTDSAIAKGASGTVSEYVGTTAGSESDTGTNYTVYNRFADIETGKWVIFFRLFGNWHCVVAEVC